MDVNAFVSGLEPALAGIMPSGISVRFDYCSLALVGDADPAALEPVIRLLTIDARDAVAGDGEIVVTTKRKRFGVEVIALNPHAEGDYVGFSVRHTGARRRDNDTLLAAVSKAVSDQRGWIDVDPKGPRGATVRVWIPERRLPAGPPLPTA